MSRYDGFGGESSIARVTSISAAFEPTALAKVPQRLHPDLAVGM